MGGAIVSKIDYIPSMKNKLMIECQFTFGNNTDFLILSTRSNGTRNCQKWNMYGNVNCDTCALRVCQKSWGNARISINRDEYNQGKVQEIPHPKAYEVVSIRIVDDGKRITF